MGPPRGRHLGAVAVMPVSESAGGLEQHVPLAVVECVPKDEQLGLVVHFVHVACRVVASSVEDGTPGRPASRQPPRPVDDGVESVLPSGGS
jgi:hypothetical protein